MITNGSFRKVYIASIPTGPAIADTGSLEVSFPQIRVISATAGQSYIWRDSNTIEIVNKGWTKLALPVATGPASISYTGGNTVLEDTTGVIYTWTGAASIAYTGGEMTMLDDTITIVVTF